MGKIKGFMEFERIKEAVVEPKDRVKNYNEFTQKKKTQELKYQAFPEAIIKLYRNY